MTNMVAWQVYGKGLRVPIAQLAHATYIYYFLL